MKMREDSICNSENKCKELRNKIMQMRSQRTWRKNSTEASLAQMENNVLRWRGFLTVPKAG